MQELICKLPKRFANCELWMANWNPGSQKHNMAELSLPRLKLVLGSFYSTIIDEKLGKRYQNASF